MYCYLAVVTPEDRVDRRCSDDSDVLMILLPQCLSLFNNTLIVLLVVTGTLCRYGPFDLARLNVAAHGTTLIICNTATLLLHFDSNCPNYIC